MLGFVKSVFFTAIVCVTLLLYLSAAAFAFYIWANTKAQKNEIEDFEKKMIYTISFGKTRIILQILFPTLFVNFIVGLTIYIWLIKKAQKEENDELVEVIVHKPARRSNKFTHSQRATLEGTGCLGDDIIDISQEILKRQFKTDGLQSSVVAHPEYKPVFGPSVQIHYDEDRRHWFTSCFRDERILIADSLFSSLSCSGKRQLVELYGEVALNPLKLVTFLDVDKQPNYYDCGVYSIANAFELLNGNVDQIGRYDNNKMRPHFIHCLETRLFSSFPQIDGSINSSTG